MVKTTVSSSKGSSFSSHLLMFCTAKTGNNGAWLARSQHERSSRRSGVCGTAASLWGRCCLFGWHKTIATSSCEGPWLGEVIPEDTWEIGSISSKTRTESPEMGALPKKASEEHQPKWAETAEPQGMAQPKQGAFWCFVTVVVVSGWRHSA